MRLQWQDNKLKRYTGTHSSRMLPSASLCLDTVTLTMSEEPVIKGTALGGGLKILGNETKRLGDLNLLPPVYNKEARLLGANVCMH